MCADIKVDTPFYQIDIDDVDYAKFENRLRSMNFKKGCKNRIYVQVHNRIYQLAYVTEPLLANSSSYQD
jgi:hypothetical protein